MKYVRPTAAELAALSFVALDPGVRNPALALFVGGRLVRAERVKVPKDVREIDDEGERARQIAELLEAWVLRHDARPETLAYELPQVYGAAKSKGDPNDLIPLALVGGALSGMLRVPVISPRPREWNMGIRKTEVGDPWESPRGMLIAKRLGAERACCEDTHDAVDATGIGLHVLGRLDRVFPGTV